MNNIELENFKNNFNEDEKVAVISMLMMSINYHRDLNEVELTHINLVADLIGLKEMDDKFILIASQGEDWLNETLKKMLLKSKDWFFIILHSMIYLNGEPTKEFIIYNLAIANSLGIEGDEYFEIINRAKHLKKAFGF